MFFCNVQIPFFSLPPRGRNAINTDDPLQHPPKCNALANFEHQARDLASIVTSRRSSNQSRETHVSHSAQRAVTIS
jgi:hypothetical protein